MSCNKTPVGAILVLALLLSSCGLMPQKSGTEQADKTPAASGKSAADNTTAASSGESAEVPFVPIPKPASANKVDVPDAARKDFARARQAMQAKHWAEAQTILLAMSETYPKLSGVYVNLGIVYQQQDKLDDAEKAYKFAIETNKTNFDAYTNLGVLYREQGKFHEAEATYKAALALWPNHYESRINLGILYDLYLDEPALALENFKIAQKILGGEEDKTLQGWIVDLERRVGEK